LPEEKNEAKKTDVRSEKPKEEEPVGSKLVTPIFVEEIAVIIRNNRL
jgi:hypothetical protein